MTIDDDIKKAGQNVQAWLRLMDEAILPLKNYCTIYSMDAQEADMSVGKAEITKALMDAIVDAVCTAIDNYDYVPAKLNITLDYEMYDVDVVVTIRKRRTHGPEANSPQED